VLRRLQSIRQGGRPYLLVRAYLEIRRCQRSSRGPQSEMINRPLYCHPNDVADDYATGLLIVTEKCRSIKPESINGHHEQKPSSEKEISLGNNEIREDEGNSKKYFCLVFHFCSWFLTKNISGYP